LTGRREKALITPVISRQLILVFAGAFNGVLVLRIPEVRAG